MDLSPVVGLHDRANDIHLVSHVSGMHAVLRLIPTRSGAPVDSQISADAAMLTWDCADGGRVRAAFESSGALRMSGAGIGMSISDASSTLTPFTGTYFFTDPIDGSHTFTSYETGRRYRITLLRGACTVRGAERLGKGARSIEISGDHGWEVVIEEAAGARPPFSPDASFDDVVDRAAVDFMEFLEAVAGWRNSQVPAADLAAYVLWSATVSPAGFLGRESILMSKHWMDKVWSWDHAFNALAVAPGLPDLALDQFLAPFDHQDVSGALPDSVTHSEVLYNFVKPPIHGWALRRLRERLASPFPEEQIEELYRRLAAWTRFWLDSRIAPSHRLPHYQHGNDSGWDNSSSFDNDRVIVSPDLAAFLIVQLDVLGELAEEIRVAEADGWRRERDLIRTALVEDLSDDAGFFAVGALSGKRSTRTSLLALLPIVASDWLPPRLVEVLATQLGEHMTEWGLATQSPRTPEYESDGYWRGPIWAPSTILIEDGLRGVGLVDLADSVSSRFRQLCESSGFAENFDALTGEGLRDRAYTWTASAYLLLARDAAMRDVSD